MNLDEMLDDLVKKFRWVSWKLETLTEDDPLYVKVLAGYTKLGKLIHDCLKLKGVEVSGASLTELLARLPEEKEKEPEKYRSRG